MQEFNKKLEEERAQEPIIAEEGKEENEKEKDEKLQKRRNEYNIKRIRQFDAFMKEAPKFIFNSNVFKNVKFAISEEEVKKDEQLVEDCAKFLKETALPKLVKSLEQLEGAPTDSESLEATFH